MVKKIALVNIFSLVIKVKIYGKSNSRGGIGKAKAEESMVIIGGKEIVHILQSQFFSTISSQMQV